MNNSNHYFIIISRLNFSRIPHSAGSIYTLTNHKNTLTLQKLYPEKEIIKNNKTFTSIYIEDKGSGFQFFSSILNETCCEPIGGKDKISNFIKNLDIEYHEYPLIIFDYCGAGNCIQSILQEAKTKSVSLYAPESFEYLLLESNLFPEINDEIIDFLSDLNEHYNILSDKQSLETFITALLKDIVSKEYKIFKPKHENRVRIKSYSKDELDPYFLSEGIIKKILKTIPSEILNLLNVKDVYKNSGELPDATNLFDT